MQKHTEKVKIMNEKVHMKIYGILKTLLSSTFTLSISKGATMVIISADTRAIWFKLVSVVSFKFAGAYSAISACDENENVRNFIWRDGESMQ